MFLSNTMGVVGSGKGVDIPKPVREKVILSPTELSNEFGPFSWTEFKRYRNAYYKLLSTILSGLKSNEVRVINQGQMIHKLNPMMRRRNWRMLITRPLRDVTLQQIQSLDMNLFEGAPDDISEELIKSCSSSSKCVSEIKNVQRIANRLKRGKFARRKRRREISIKNAARFYGEIMNYFGLSVTDLLKFVQMDDIQGLPCYLELKPEKEWKEAWKTLRLRKQPDVSFERFYFAMNYPWRLAEYAGIPEGSVSYLKGRDAMNFYQQTGEWVGNPLSMIWHAVAIAGIPKCLEVSLGAKISGFAMPLMSIAFAFVPGLPLAAQTALKMGNKMLQYQQASSAQKKVDTLLMGGVRMKAFAENQERADLQRARKDASTVNRITNKELGSYIKSGKTVPLDNVVSKISRQLTTAIQGRIPDSVIKQALVSALQEELPKSAFVRGDRKALRPGKPTPTPKLKQIPKLAVGGVAVAAVVLAVFVAMKS